MYFWQAIFLSIVEGITEFLPISSTAHLEFAVSLLKITQTDFVKSFEIFIQFGAILSVVILYFRKLVSKPSLIFKTFIAFLPTGILGLFFYKFIKAYLLGNSWVAVFALFAGGLLLLIVKDHGHTKKISDLNLLDLLCLGLFQSLSMVPGVSRSLATILGGEYLGLTRSEAVEMSFLLAIPTMAAATGFDLVKSLPHFSISHLPLFIIGFVGAFVSALIVVNWLTQFVQNHNLKTFAGYRLILATIWALLIFFQVLP